jgi:ribosome-associated toxin RatA of RatAB toxin-antitoxin module
MGTIINEITIDASMEKIWSILTDVELLDKYDPTVKKSIRISNEKTGLGAKRKVNMLDGKNWFEEKISVFEINKALTYQLTDCSFPIKALKHSYTFTKMGNQIKVQQIMEYTVKFGLLGKLLDGLMIRKQLDTGIKKFFAGLKQYAEKN